MLVRVLCLASYASILSINNESHGTAFIPEFFD
jgi:hypothetical protein